MSRAILLVPSEIDPARRYPLITVLARHHSMPMSDLVTAVGMEKSTVTRQIDAIVRRCLAKEAEERYPSARELRDELLDLRQSLEGEETSQIDRSSLDWLEGEAAEDEPETPSGLWRRLKNWRSGQD